MKKFLFVLILAFAFLGQSFVGKAVETSTFCTISYERTELRYINAYRERAGVQPLVFTKSLGAAARHHSRDMGHYDYFSHTLYGGITWGDNIRNHGYPSYATIGENIAAGNASAEDTFYQWKFSPDHNENMVNPAWKAIGIGYADYPGSTYRYYWTTTFGTVVDGPEAPAC